MVADVIGSSWIVHDLHNVGAGRMGRDVVRSSHNKVVAAGLTRASIK
jgi:hypothetical protein